MKALSPTAPTTAVASYFVTFRNMAEDYKKQMNKFFLYFIERHRSAGENMMDRGMRVV